MDKLKMRSRDRLSANIEKIGQLFPNCLTECIGEDGEPRRAIDFDLLRQELSPAVAKGAEERYQFTWPGKKMAMQRVNTPVTKTLRPAREESVDFDSTQNLYIEGDNLDVLKLMQESYLGQVKLIYIDPPYNTGTDRLAYRDNYTMTPEGFAKASGQYDENGGLLFEMETNNEGNGRFHSSWLSALYPPLRLAWDLLREDGVILINMDENEITNLQRLCQEIFGEQNDLGTIVWDKRNPKGDAQGISCQHEYILAYAKSKPAFLQSNRLQRPKKNAAAILKKAAQLFATRAAGRSLEEINREFGAWMREQADFSGGEKAYNKIDEEGQVYRPVSMAWPNKKTPPDSYFVPLVHPATGKPCPVPKRGWRNPPATMQRLLAQGRILFGKDERTIPNSKYLLRDNMMENIPSLLYYGGSDTAYLEELGIPFDTPKVAEICKEHILALTAGQDIVLDFYSGSATVAHAVMLANAEDGAQRRYIMVQLPEPCPPGSPLGKKGFATVCQAGRQRIRLSAERIEADIDRGFRVLRLDSSNMKDVYYGPAGHGAAPAGTPADSIKEGRSPEDLLFQVMLELGVPPSSALEARTIGGRRVFTVAGGVLMACFDPALTEAVITAIAKKKPRYFVMRDGALAGGSTAARLEQIFAAHSPGTVRKLL